MPFPKGKPKPANSGRRKGTPNKATERAQRLISAADDKAIVKRVVEGAKANDPEARRLYFRHLRPPPPRAETFVGPIDYTAPRTPEEARQALLALGERVARREIPVELHDALVAGIRAYLGDKAVEQQKRLDELEDALRSGDPP